MRRPPSWGGVSTPHQCPRVSKIPPSSVQAGPGAYNRLERALCPAIRRVAWQRVVAVSARRKACLVLCHDRFHHFAVDAAHILCHLPGWQQSPRAGRAVARAGSPNALAFCTCAEPMPLQQRLQLVAVGGPRGRRQRLLVARGPFH